MDLNAIARSVENLSASIDQRLSGMEKRIKTTDDALGNIIVPRSTANGNGKWGDRLKPEFGGTPMGGQLATNFGGGEVNAAEKEYIAIGNFVRSEGKSLSLPSVSASFGGDELLSINPLEVGSDPKGGYVVAPHVSGEIRKRTYDVSPLARLARYETITDGDAFEEPIDDGDIEAAWVGEKDERPELDTTTLRMMRVPVNEIYTNQPITQRLLDDSQRDIGAWIEDKISDKFARKEGAAFVWGDGNLKPEGLLFRPSSTAKDGVRDYFQLQHVWSGFDPDVPDGFKGDIMIDALVNAVYQLRAPYRGNARWLMNRNTAARIRKIKDADGRFIFSDTTEGVTPTLLGFPVEFDEEMPDVANGVCAIAFGDFKQGYIIVDKVGVRLLLDPYTKKPFVLFYAYRRVGGQVQNGEAIKLIKFGLPA